MGRRRTFSVGTAVAAAQQAFVTRGYAGTSVDDLLRATGLQRSSLYQAFGSKRGLFAAALDRLEVAQPWTDGDLDLLLVALMDVAPHDRALRLRIEALVRVRLHDPARALGARLLARAKVGAPDGERSPREEGDAS